MEWKVGQTVGIEELDSIPAHNWRVRESMTHASSLSVSVATYKGEQIKKVRDRLRANIENGLEPGRVARVTANSVVINFGGDTVPCWSIDAALPDKTKEPGSP